MSLRTDDDRNGRSGRSRSSIREPARNNSSSATAPLDDKDYFRKLASGPAPASGSNSVPGSRDDRRTKPVMPPGGFGQDSDSDERSKYHVYAPREPSKTSSARMPDLPGLDDGLVYGDESESEESEESDDERHRRSRRVAPPSQQGMPYPQEVKHMPRAPVDHIDADRHYYASPPQQQQQPYATQPAYATQQPYGYASPPTAYSAKEQAPKDGDRYSTKKESPTRKDSRRLSKSLAEAAQPSGRARASSVIEPPRTSGRSRGDSTVEPPSSILSRYVPPSPPEEDDYSNPKALVRVEPKQSHRMSISSANDAHYAVRAPPSASLAPDAGSGRRASRLSVSGNRPDVQGFGSGHLPPASPLLEAYRGTYQTASPMPSPMMLPADLDDLPVLEPLSSDGSSSGRRKSSSGKKQPKKKVVKLYDAEGDAQILAKALKHREARTEPLIDILPELTHDQLLHLRNEYKKLVKVHGRGVNIAKQIKVGTTGNFGKAAYVTALGRWESEAYWANFWYQSRTSSRELLIEALMGRTNAEMREVKSAFKDKRYDDSLSRCMEKELKADKFRMAVLLALDARRQEETDTMSEEYRLQDVNMLFRALTGREGGETAILQVVVTRSDTHLREVLKTYERMYRVNFAREALKKSNNLVGEVIAHILNGVINRVARDCLLLHHAIEDISTHNKSVEFRYELLMSRLIRLHWDRLHLVRVKDEFRSKYGVSLEREIKEATKGDFGDFCLKLASSA